MENIKIITADVTAAASSLRSCNGMIYDLLQRAKQEMDRLSHVWQSESSDTIRQKFSQFSNQFENQRQIIDAYAQFLDHTAATYDSVETAINSNATSFK